MGKAVAQVYWMRERLLKREVIATKDEEWQPPVRREWDEWDDKVNFQDNRMKEDDKGIAQVYWTRERLLKRP